MLDILSKIAVWKKLETSGRKENIPLEFLKDQAGYHAPCFSLSDKLKSSAEPQVIAEFKRRSPSKGIIRAFANPEKICTGYQLAGAAAISVLTDEKFFGAHPEDLQVIRKEINLPILRKDFILEEYQVHESKAMGADIILLIAALLNPAEVMELGSLARDIGMDVLLELHSEEELNCLCEAVSLLGVNNRNLKNFKVDLAHSINLARQLPAGIPTIAESGLSDPARIIELHRAGFKGFLIGEFFMRSEDPGMKCKEMIDKII